MALEQYLQELKKIRLLAPEEEASLWQGYKQRGDLECRAKLIEHYQPLVFKVASRGLAGNSSVMDVIQEGTIGLIEAVESYDPSRGVAFSLFAVHRIRGRMLNYLKREGGLDWEYIDSPAGQADSGVTMADLLVDSSADVSRQAEHNFLVEQVKQAMDRLPLKEQLVVSGVFLDEREPRQLAQSLDMSISHLYRLQKQGIRRMRGMLSKLMQEMKL
ncbi:MAG: sigma-70 family RNA polymerase sigma factor [Negativicutes bacterium]|nr:sigma-70 family RNA polymerase sigma factor [Negativicutes bacterium]